MDTLTPRSVTTAVPELENLVSEFSFFPYPERGRAGTRIYFHFLVYSFLPSLSLQIQTITKAHIPRKHSRPQLALMTIANIDTFRKLTPAPRCKRRVVRAQRRRHSISLAVTRWRSRKGGSWPHFSAGERQRGEPVEVKLWRDGARRRSSYFACLLLRPTRFPPRRM